VPSWPAQLWPQQCRLASNGYQAVTNCLFRSKNWGRSFQPFTTGIKLHQAASYY
jgi:hypothetical protein